MAPLKWGILGSGKISGDFVSALGLLDAEKHEVVAVGASALDKANDFKTRFRLTGANAYGSYDEVMKDGNVDVVYVGVLNSAHHSLVLSALDHGKHVLCEKPMGLNVKQVTEMVNKAREKKKFLMEPTESNTRLYDLSFGGGYLYDIGCYPLQFTTWVMGCTEKPVEINANGFIHETGVDDTASITLKYASGKIAQLFYTGSAYPLNSAQVCGTKGRLMIPDFFWCPDTLVTHTVDPVTLRTDEETRVTHSIPTCADTTFTYPNSGGLSYQAECVRKCIEKGHLECPDMTLDESILIAEILQEIRRQLGVKFPQD